MNAKGQKGLVTSAELAASLGVKLSTVHFYTTLGLLTAQKRLGNRKLYELKEAKGRFDKIQRLRQVGYTIQLICRRLREEKTGP